MIESNCFFFFFQAEDGIRDLTVTGVQTCALPIWSGGGQGGIGDDDCNKCGSPNCKRYHFGHFSARSDGVSHICHWSTSQLHRSAMENKTKRYYSPKVCKQ